MGWQLNDDEFENVRLLPARERYRYFIKKVADAREVWSLWNSGWALMGDDEGESVPVWPHFRFAQAFAAGEWKDYEPRAITLNDWVAKWIPGMEADRRHAAVFPATGPTTRASASQLRRDLQEELRKYGE